MGEEADSPEVEVGEADLVAGKKYCICPMCGIMGSKK